MSQPVIVSACRTPIGRFMGGLSSFKAPRLGALVVEESLKRAGADPKEIDEVFMGTVLQAGQGQNPARQAALWGGLPETVSACTINKVCGSGLESVMLAARGILAGETEAAVAGGFEVMSQAPYLLPQARAGMRLGHAQCLDEMIQDGLWDVYNDYHMGMTAELVASEYGISREEQDAYAAESQRRAVAAIEAGKFAPEILPVEVKGRKGEVTVIDTDEGPRPGTTVEKLSKLRPAFKPDGGTVTAGNSSTINDGAAAVTVFSEDKAKALGLKPMARILGYATGGMAPQWVMMAPEVAFEKVCALTRINLKDFDLIELNEAFAVQAVALTKKLGLDPAKVNVNGGAVALGHPIGCSGARLLVTLIHALKDRGLSRGVAGLCLGGGNAVAMAVELM
ncbi:MAG TPA: acetyl-CoA C-acetyltransferase [Planctomycetes bacterium]|nr:acetyl-CoA C-acetyltransferase [Planctomycetota bacterium]